MKQIILPVTVHLNIRLPLALLQPEPADAPTGPEPEAHACQGCGALFTPGSNRAKYCPECAPKVHRRQKAECERRRRVQRGQLEGKNPL